MIYIQEEDVNIMNKHCDQIEALIMELNKYPQGKARNEHFGLPW